MVNTEKKYHSKLLLLGEYITIKGGQALAMPLPNYRGQWCFQSHSESLSLFPFFKYLKNLQNRGESGFQLNLSSFQKALENQLYFESNIPIGYGLGSSGALCAAIYDSFALDKIDSHEVKRWMELKKILAQMESFFHGESSGTDPLICYLHQPVLIESKKTILPTTLPLNFPPNDQSLFLIDTGISRKTGPLVKLFLKKCEDEYYNQRCQTELLSYNDDAIAAYLQGNWALFFELVHQISYFQFKYFQEMIPEDFRTLWLEGLSGTDFKLKLCGAGGGGFILGIGNEKSVLPFLSNLQKILILSL